MDKTVEKKELTVEELKALAYDHVSEIERLTFQLRQIQEQIKLKLSAEPKEPKKE